MALNGESVPDDEREAGFGVLPEDELLPCGRELSYVWEQREAGAPDPHADGCPHCAQALDALRLLEGVVTEARDTAPPEREQDTSALAARVMDVVRLELRPGRTLPLGDEDEDAWIVEAAAARTVRAAAESLPGVRAGSCRIGPLEEPESPAPSGRLPRGPVRIRVEVQVPFTWNLPEVADRVRHRVIEAVDDELGMPVAVVDVTISDLIDDGDGDDQADESTEGRQR
ncbi:Asp23/Gls24 family envelope stress response protein [Streptomyces sp. NBC_01283]|uniref:Asp23/Gls24 family envelope stress response protein n=1 Tax=Streptomyces sp. NBC_01283 TaxID=2903812 RepID=UPI00352E2D6F|nr:Asp23/Gls24 family envelope stress response protein [Streptomyces sp. NBC_01283]